MRIEYELIADFDELFLGPPNKYFFYRAVGNRCALDFDSLKLAISREEILSILLQKKFKVLEVDIIALARKCVGVSQYHRGALLAGAPEVFDCSSFIKYLYGQKGIWLPRRSIQQSKLGESRDSELSGLGLVAGDAVFVSGRIDYYDQDPKEGIGHVGIYTGEGTVVHAANRESGVVESKFDDFANQSNLRTIRRYMPIGFPIGSRIVTLETPANREIEISDDIRWVILQSLGK